MRIKIEQWEVLKAVELYFKNEYGVDCDLVEGLQEWPLIDYQERVEYFLLLVEVLLILIFYKKLNLMNCQLPTVIF